MAKVKNIDLSWPERFARNTRIVEAYAAGQTLREIGLTFGVTHTAIRQILGAVGLTASNRARAEELKKALVSADERFQRVMASLVRGEGTKP